MVQQPVHTVLEGNEGTSRRALVQRCRPRTSVRILLSFIYAEKLPRFILPFAANLTTHNNAAVPLLRLQPPC